MFQLQIFAICSLDKPFIKKIFYKKA